MIGSTGRGGYGHGLDTAFVGVERAEIVALADPSAEGRQETAARLSVPSTYADYRQMLQAAKPDIVCIGPSWLNQRVKMIEAAAEVGAHIFCEKPFGCGSFRTGDSGAVERKMDLSYYGSGEGILG